MITARQMNTIKWSDPEQHLKQKLRMSKAIKRYWSRFTDEEKSRMLKERAKKRKLNYELKKHRTINI